MMSMSIFNSITDKIKEHFPPKHDDFGMDKDIDNLLKGDSTSTAARSASVLEASKPKDRLNPLNPTPPPAQSNSPPQGASVSDMLSSSSTQPPIQASPIPIQQTPQPQYTPEAPQFSTPENNFPPNTPNTIPPSAPFNPLEKQVPPQQGYQDNNPATGNSAGSTGLDIHNIKSVMGEVPLQTPPTPTFQPVSQPSQPTQLNQSDSVLNRPVDDMINLKMDIRQMKEKLDLIIEKLSVVEERTSKY